MEVYAEVVERSMGHGDSTEGIKQARGLLQGGLWQEQQKRHH